MLSTQIMDRQWKTHVEIAPNCPRCSSSNTKFCYYNNYSLSQPRYFCKGCRRYWTKGGSLRNVPVGGGCRKSRRARSARIDDHHRSTSSNYSPVPGDFRETGSHNNGSDIDLAVVFAKFLNQEVPEFHRPENSEEFVSVAANSLTSDSDTTTAMEFHPAPDTSDVIIQDSDFVEEFPLQLEIDQELNEFGLQSLLGDELVQDALWSEMTTSNLSNNDVTWQPEEFDSLMAASDDQLKIPANFMIDHNAWSSFDLSGF